MSMNIPLMLKDHGPTTLAELDEEIARLVSRIADLAHRRSMIQTHLAVQQAFVPDLEPSSAS